MVRLARTARLPSQDQPAVFGGETSGFEVCVRHMHRISTGPVQHTFSMCNIQLRKWLDAAAAREVRTAFRVTDLPHPGSGSCRIASEHDKRISYILRIEAFESIVTEWSCEERNSFARCTIEAFEVVFRGIMAECLTPLHISGGRFSWKIQGADLTLAITDYLPDLKGCTHVRSR